MDAAVTVIMPAYNSSMYIAEAITSVQSQTFGDFELNVVDDGSTDDTAEIVRGFTRNDRRVRLLRQQNGGISAARNTAIAHAHGRLLALLDSDDVWLPCYLAEQLAILDDRPHLAILSANAFSLGGATDGEPLKPINGAAIQDISLSRLIEVDDSMCIMTVFRREVVDTIGLFDARLRRSEDYDFWLRAALAGFQIGFNPRPLARYRRRGDSMSADETEMIDAIITVLKKIRGLAVEYPEIQTAIDRELAGFTRQRLISLARRALLQGDQRGVTEGFSQLRDSTGALRYRVASWLSGRAPETILWAYKLQQIARRLGLRGRRLPSPR
jgi:glycosyltransferase involved in cell wall biosynthesis